jgi:hypothetical protein
MGVVFEFYFKKTTSFRIPVPLKIITAQKDAYAISLGIE